MENISFTLSLASYFFIIRWLECRIFVRADSIVPRYREVESRMAVSGMCHPPFLHSFLQSAESCMVAKSTQVLQFLGGDVGMVLEVFSQQAVYFDVADFRGCL